MTQSNSEHTIIIIKFVTRGDAKQDLEQIKNDILTQGKDRTDLRIPGIKSFKFKTTGLPFTRDMLLTEKEVCKDVYLNNLFNTTFGIASLFIS